MAALLAGVRDMVAPSGRRYYTPRRLNREGEMAKRFFYLSLGLLCLVAAYQMGAERARADRNGNGPGDATRRAATVASVER
jgi:hypothetical protein